MSGLAQGAVGLTLLMAGWLAPRRVAGARRSSAAALVLDAAPLTVVAALALLAGGRPIAAGALAFGLGAGFAFADRTTRRALREPVTFVALSELPQLFTHPHLYLPFAGVGTVFAGAAAAMSILTGLLTFEPTALSPQPPLAIAAGASVGLVCWGIARRPRRAARRLRRLDSSGEPLADAARLGPAAMLIAHGIIARADRPARQARLAVRAVARDAEAANRPLILVQCESFFDARRLLPLPQDFLAGYDACGARHGRLDVPAWGANSTRAEFAVLTGIDERALGHDRFNPYHALTRAPIASQVWRLRRAGYRTICLHPFDRWFYRRDLAMPALGFERFLGRETLGGSRTPPYMADRDLAAHILQTLDAQGPRVFIFAITMGNHGPWLSRRTQIDLAIDRLVDRGMPQRVEVLHYLDGLRETDEMLRILIGGLERRGSDAVLACYGDHLPSLPRAFAHLGWTDWRSDYAIRGATGELAGQRDLAAHELGRAVVDLALAPRAPLRRDSVVRERRRA